MSYTNDSKPSGSSTNETNLTNVAWDSASFAWDSASANWDGLAVYSSDSKPSGSYSNDVKPT